MLILQPSTRFVVTTVVLLVGSIPSLSKADEHDLLRIMRSKKARMQSQINACELLVAHIDSPQVVQELVKALADDVGFWAAQTLRKADESNLEYFTSRALAETCDVSMKRHLQMMKQIATSDVDPWLMLHRAVKSNVAEHRHSALAILYQITRTDPRYRNRVGVTLCDVLQNGQDVSIRLHAASILAQHYSLRDEYVRDVEDYFRDPKLGPVLRVSALRTLGSARRIRSVMKTIEAVAQGPDPILSYTAVRCLGIHSEDSDHCPLLREIGDKAAANGDKQLLQETIAASKKICSRIQYRRKAKEVVARAEVWRKDVLERLKKDEDWLHAAKMRSDSRLYGNNMVYGVSALIDTASSYSHLAKCRREAGDISDALAFERWAVTYLEEARSRLETGTD